MTSAKLGFLLGHPPQVIAIVIIAHVLPITWAVLWLIPRTRKGTSRFVLPGFAGVICFLVAFRYPDLMLRWDIRFEQWLRSIAPRPFVALTKEFMYPTVYLLGAWVLGFALALQVVLWRENKRKQEPISVSD
jgi:hypothetical protein